MRNKKLIPPHLAIKMDEIKAERKREAFAVAEASLVNGHESIQFLAFDGGEGPVLRIQKSDKTGLEFNLASEAFDCLQSFCKDAAKFDEYSTTDEAVFEGTGRHSNSRDKLGSQKLFSLEDVIGLMEAAKKSGVDVSLGKLKTLKTVYGGKTVSDRDLEYEGSPALKAGFHLDYGDDPAPMGGGNVIKRVAGRVPYGRVKAAIPAPKVAFYEAPMPAEVPMPYGADDAAADEVVNENLQNIPQVPPQNAHAQVIHNAIAQLPNDKIEKLMDAADMGDDEFIAELHNLGVN